ncbi:MAG TPA: HD domain-containing protein, partial [Alphaproteobacteria bacterium]|nr:HD domain-containing protein [Alphaproteobacteria bacterium]
MAEVVRANTPNTDFDRIECAFRFADEHHGKQVRASGDPYISHPLAVAGILAQKRLDGASLATALL